MALRFPFAAVVLVLAGCAATQEEYSPQLAPPSDLALHGRQLNFVGGLRSFEDEAFGEIDQPIVLALDYAVPFGLETMRVEGGFHYAYDEGDGTSGGQEVRLKNTTIEVSAGLNYALLLERFRPYLGFGGSFLYAKLRGVDQDVDELFDDGDWTVGGYAKAGILFQITRVAHIGLEYRHLEGGEITLDDTDLSTNYDQFAVVVGTSFE